MTETIIYMIMKKTFPFLGIMARAAAAAALIVSIASCNGGSKPAAAPAKTDSLSLTGSIVYFNLDKVMSGYDMANDLRSVVETKVAGIQSEIDRRGSKLQNDINSFQEKLDKGLLTRSVAEAQGQKLEQQRADYQNYAMQKNNEIAEEQQVMLNQIMNAIMEFVEKYNEEKQFALILTTQGDILPMPVAIGQPQLDITDELLLGLNEEYVKTKDSKK